MESLLTRYRHITILLLVLFAQLILLAYQVKTNEDMRLIRVWSVTAVTPLARLIESARSTAVRLVENYILLVGVRQENRSLEAELGRLKMENRFLTTELSTADRAQALLAFQRGTPSRTTLARVIGTGAGSNSKVVFVDRGSADRVRRGMAVVTPDGIVGRIEAIYPTAALVLLVTDPSFAAGVVSQKGRVEGTLKGRGRTDCLVDYLQNEQRVEVGEMFYTSGDDRLFPRGFPVGPVVSVQQGRTFKEVRVSPAGLRKGLEEVLIVLEGVHVSVPEVAASAGDVNLLPPPPADQASVSAAEPASEVPVLGTDADRLREQYRKIGEAQGHVFGEGAPGTRPPDFNLKLQERPPVQSPRQPAASPGVSAEHPSAGPPSGAASAPSAGQKRARTEPSPNP